MLRLRVLPALAAALCLSMPADAQSNAEVGYDVSIVNLGPPTFRGRLGTWPNGGNAVSYLTTSCNVGTQNVPWQSAMNEDHPMIAFLVAAERDGRMVQISDYSYVKHGFLSTNSPGCGNCGGGPGSLLTVGCSDTYGPSTNANNFYLGPPDEIDPWLGTWASVCSHFDRGEPPVPPPADCDGQRSLTIQQANNLGPVGHRVRIFDSELEDPGNTQLINQAYYVVRREFEAVRGNNISSMPFSANWTGSQYSFSQAGAAVQGTVLDHWTGATVASEAGGGFDGRVFIGATATQQGNLHHYEYGLYNRDNVGGIDGLRIPLATGAQVLNVGVRDIDGDPANDWTATVVGNELVFAAGTNALRWNTLYNVWFDSDAAPATGSLNLESAISFPDINVVGLPTPTGALPQPGVNYCTAGTSFNGCVATLSATGTPSATLPSGFVMTGSTVEGLVNGQFFFGSNGRQANPWGSGTSFQCVVPPVARAGTMTGSGTVGLCDGTFVQDMNARWTAKPATNPGAGAVVQLQLWYRDPQNTSNQTTSLSDAYEVTVQP